MNPADRWNPQVYERFKNERFLPYDELVAGIHERPIRRAIDLGCGTGELSARLFDRVQPEEMLAIDSSASMLSKAAAFHRPRLFFREQRIEDLVDRDGFDLVFSNAALQWCSDHHGLFGRLASLVRPGGQLAIQVPANFDHPSHLVARELATESPWDERLAGFLPAPSVLLPEDYSELLFRLGFADQEVRLRVYLHVLASREEVVEWVKGTMLTAYESRLSPAHFAEFLHEYRRRLFRVLPEEKPFPYPFKRILAWGRR